MKKTTFGKEIFFIAIVFLLLTAFVNYKGNFHPFYFDAWQFYREGFGYEFDIYLKNSIVHSSIIYKLFGILKINVDDDLVGLGYQIFCNGIGFFFTYKIAQEFLDEKEKSVSLAIALSVALYYSILLHTTYSGWASNHSNTPSILAHSLMFPLVWLLIRKNWIWVGLISSFMVLTAIKVAWFPVGICIIYAFFTNGKVSHRLGWIPIPILSTLYIGRQGVQIPSNENIRNELWNNTRLIDGAESFLDLQNTWLLCFFFFSMLIFWILINQQKFKNSKLYNLSSIILFASLGLAILGGLYGRFGHLIHADPKIIMLSPVRSMALYQFFFSILVSVVIVRLKIPVITIAGLLAGTYYFSAANNLLYIMLIASFIIVWTPSKIIKQIADTEVNTSNVTAIVEDISKKNSETYK